jgi:hypothetical protein
MSEGLSCLGAVALELSMGRVPARDSLDQAAAGELAALVARDIARLVPAAADLDFALLAGTFDPVELLRPRWPLHAEIERLVAQAPGAGVPRVIAFGARDGQLPDTLRPQPDFRDGPLRLLPFVLRGDPARVAEVGALLEETLLDRGMAAADTALLAQQAFGATIEHARYLTVHDLAAMTAMQYEHVGLGPVWPLIETALLAPRDEAWLDAPPEPLLRLANGEVRLALLDDEAWRSGGFARADDTDAARLVRAFEQFQMRQRQLAAVLEAHGIPVTFDFCASGQDPRAVLRA